VIATAGGHGSPKNRPGRRNDLGKADGGPGSRIGTWVLKNHEWGPADGGGLGNTAVDFKNMGSGNVTGHSYRSGTYQTGVTPMTQVPARHPFDDRVDELQRQNGGSRSAAMTQARLLYPAVYQSYLNGGTAQQQQMQRGQTSEQFGKLGQSNASTWPQ